MNKMVYIPDGLVEEIKIEAGKRGQSFSGYLVGLHRSAMGVSGQQRVVIQKPKDAEAFQSYSKDSQLGKRKK